MLQRNDEMVGWVSERAGGGGKVARSRRATVWAITAGALVAASVVAGCGNKDPEENFQLWSNNDEGWQEIGKYVGDGANDVALRARALEVLVENGHPRIAPQLLTKVADKDVVIAALHPKLEKLLLSPNEKIQLNAKLVLYELLNIANPESQNKIRTAIAAWALGDLTHDEPVQATLDKLGKRMSGDEIERLGAAAVAGAEILAGKGVQHPRFLVLLQNVDTPESKAALVAGLRRYHNTPGKKVKVTGDELGYVQRTNHIDGLMYFFEVYETRAKSDHPDDDAASKMAIAAAVQWVDEEAGRKMVEAGWAKLEPKVQQLLAGPKCDLRWWAVTQLIRKKKEDGLAEGLKGLPDDTNYGQEEFSLNDVKLMITDLCTKDTEGLNKDKTRALYKASLQTERFIERIVAIRCLMADGSDDARAALQAFIDARKANKEEKIIDPFVVPQHAENLTLPDLAKIAIETIDYGRALDKLASEGKITADQAKYRKLYAGFSFDRKGKDLAAFAEERAEDKIKREAAKKAGGGK